MGAMLVRYATVFSPIFWIAHNLNTLPKSRLQRAKYALPSMVTLLSIACGFASIVISVDNAGAGDPADLGKVVKLSAIKKIR